MFRRTVVQFFKHRPIMDAHSVLIRMHSVTMQYHRFTVRGLALRVKVMRELDTTYLSTLPKPRTFLVFFSLMRSDRSPRHLDQLYRWIGPLFLHLFGTVRMLLKWKPVPVFCNTWRGLTNNFPNIRLGRGSCHTNGIHYDLIESFHFIASFSLSFWTTCALHAFCGLCAFRRFVKPARFPFMRLFLPLILFCSLCSMCLLAWMCVQMLSLDTLKEDSIHRYENISLWSHLTP